MINKAMPTPLTRFSSLFHVRCSTTKYSGQIHLQNSAYYPFVIYNVYPHIKGSEKLCSKEVYLALLTLFNAVFLRTARLRNTFPVEQLLISWGVLA